MDRGAKGCLAAAAFTVVGGTLLCGGSCVVGVLWGPAWALSTIVQEEPSAFEAVLDNQSTADQIVERLNVELTETRTTRVTAAQLNTLASDFIRDEDGKVAFTFDGQHGLFEFSGNMGENGEQAWINGALGGTFAMEKGQFTTADFDVARVGSWDVSSLITGAPMVADLNRFMDEQRSENVDFAAMQDAIEKLAVENDELTITTNDHWEAAVEAMAD